MADATVAPPWLEQAAKVGSILCATAVRHYGRCSWLGRSVNELKRGAGSIQPTVSGLGPDLYDGTAGVAMFLAQLYMHTQEEETKTIALEAAAHALDQSQRSASQFGLYSGWTGIAFGAARVAHLLDTPTLAARARSLLAPLESHVGLDAAPCDLIGGLAGSITALMSWPRPLSTARDLDTCERLGSALAAAAVPWEGTWAWSAARAMGGGLSSSSSQPLTGMSHGASGMGVVLIALAERTANVVFQTVGRGAFAYEAKVFSEHEANWPDFRINDYNPNGRSYGSLGWCHGAPGIALARLHALKIETRPEWQKDWEIALGVSQRRARVDYHESADLSMCHGIAGLLEPLVEAATLREDSAAHTIREDLARIWSCLCGRFSKTNTWPSGLPSHGPNPSLMLGTAGIGYTFLRMHDPKTPSVLLPLLGSER